MDQDTAYTLDFSGDRPLWVLEKFTVACVALKGEGPIKARLDEALLEIVPVSERDVPPELRPDLLAIRRAIRPGWTEAMTTAEAKEIVEQIVMFRDAMDRRIERP